MKLWVIAVIVFVPVFMLSILKAIAKAKRKENYPIYIPHSYPDACKTKVSKDEFFQFVIPHIKLLEYWPEGYGENIDIEIAEDLWDATQTLPEWKISQALFDKWAPLNFDSKYLALSTTGALKFYRTFKTAKENGYSTVIVMKDNHHCKTRIPQKLSIAEIDNAYAGNGSISVLVPFPWCKKNSMDGGGLCGCRIWYGSKK